MKGMKIGGDAPILNAWIAYLGAAPTAVPDPELYTSIETGVIDGYWDTQTGFNSLKMYELPLYIVDHPFYGSDDGIIMNLNTFNGLSKELQDVLIESVKEVEIEHAWMRRGMAEDMRKIATDAGVKIIKFSAEDAKWWQEKSIEVGWQWFAELYPDEVDKVKNILLPGS